MSEILIKLEDFRLEQLRRYLCTRCNELAMEVEACSYNDDTPPGEEKKRKYEWNVANADREFVKNNDLFTVTQLSRYMRAIGMLPRIAFGNECELAIVFLDDLRQVIKEAKARAKAIETGVFKADEVSS